MKQLTLHGSKKTRLGITIFTVMALICFTISKANAAITTTSSSDITAPTTSPNAPFVLYSGIINPSGATATSTIDMGCPTNFVARITLAPRTLDASSTSKLRSYSSVKLCQFTASTTSITIAVQRKAYYQTASTLDNDGYYMAVLNWAYGAGSSWGLPDTVDISDDNNSDDTIMKNISYTIVCYPSGTEPAAIPVVSCT